MRTLLIDDMKPIQADVVARSFIEGMAALRVGSIDNASGFDVLYLDCDLGSGFQESGISILDWLSTPEGLKCRPKRIELITATPEVVELMIEYAEKAGYKQKMCKFNNIMELV